MKRLRWDIDNLTKFLGVTPKVESDGDDVECTYAVIHSGVTLEIYIYPNESAVFVWLRQTMSKLKLLDIVVIVREEILTVKNELEEYIEFRNCVVISNQLYAHKESDVFDHTLFPDRLTLRIYTKPQLQIIIL